MPELLLEIPLDGTPKEYTLPLEVYVQKRTERFRFNPTIPQTAAPVAYLEPRPLDSWVNVNVMDRTYTVPLNSYSVISRGEWRTVVSASISSEYRDLAITHVVKETTGEPLFLKHQLPIDTVDARIVVVENGNEMPASDDYVVSIEDGAVYTNFENWFNPYSGNYKLFFVVSSDADGVVTHTLLNTESVVREATWEDIDLDTGEIREGLIVYTKEKVPGGYVFYFDVGREWHYRPLASSLIVPQLPEGRTSEDSWHLRFSNGEVTGLVNGAVRRYSIVEYDRQPFFPYKPVLYSSYVRMTRVNGRTVQTSSKKLSIDPDTNLHAEVRVYDAEDNLLRVFTTDVSLEGSRYQNTAVLYESDKILCWDNGNGFIVFGVDLLPSWQLDGALYRIADSFEYTGLSFNPVENESARRYSYLFYVIPDVTSDETSLHYVVIDRQGKIIDSTQRDSVSYPAISLRLENGDYNVDTLVGQNVETFYEMFLSGYSNDYGYMLLAEVSLQDRWVEEDLFVVPVEQRLAALKDSAKESAYAANPRLLYSRLGYGAMEQPTAPVMVVEVPLSITEDYGGTLTADKVEELIRLHVAANTVTVLDWQYPRTAVEITSPNVGEVTLQCSWEGPGLTYKVYRTTSLIDAWTEIDSEFDPVEGGVVFTDVGLLSGVTYFYTVRITDNEIEFPGTVLSVVVQ